MAKKIDMSFQKFKDFRFSLLNEDFEKYDTPEGLRGKLESLEIFLTNPENIKKLDEYFIKITNKTEEMQILESVKLVLNKLQNIVKEN